MNVPLPVSRHRNPFLARLQRLAGTDDADLAALERLLKDERQACAHVDVSPEKGGPEQVHVLLDGWACRYRLMADGQRQITMLLVPGDPCDFDALCVRRVGYAVGTLTPCTVAALDATSVRALAARRPGVAQALRWLREVENANLAEHIVSLGRRSGQKRTAHLLCELFLRLEAVGHTQGGNGYGLPLTQEELGDTLGLSAVHVNRLLQALRSEGLITLRDRELVILDWDALSETAEFRPEYLHLKGANAIRGGCV